MLGDDIEEEIGQVQFEKEGFLEKNGVELYLKRQIGRKEGYVYFKYYKQFE